jgi:hypothetical protein
MTSIMVRWAGHVKSDKFAENFSRKILGEDATLEELTLAGRKDDRI